MRKKGISEEKLSAPGSREKNCFLVFHPYCNHSGMLRDLPFLLLHMKNVSVNEEKKQD